MSLFHQSFCSVALLHRNERSHLSQSERVLNSVRDVNWQRINDKLHSERVLAGCNYVCIYLTCLEHCRQLFDQVSSRNYLTACFIVSRGDLSRNL